MQVREVVRPSHSRNAYGFEGIDQSTGEQSAACRNKRIQLAEWLDVEVFEVRGIEVPLPATRVPDVVEDRFAPSGCCLQLLV